MQGGRKWRVRGRRTNLTAEANRARTAAWHDRAQEHEQDMGGRPHPTGNKRLSRGGTRGRRSRKGEKGDKSRGGAATGRGRRYGGAAEKPYMRPSEKERATKGKRKKEPVKRHRGIRNTDMARTEDGPRRTKTQKNLTSIEMDNPKYHPRNQDPAT